MIANIFNIEVDTLTVEEGPAMGGAMLAAVGCGVFDSVVDAAAKIVRVKETTKPDSELVEKYEKKYQNFKSIYPQLKDVFAKM